MLAESRRIAYRKGYKYQLAEDAIFHVDIHPKHDIITEFIELTTEGKLTTRRGYAWDGPSGPTIDTKNFMRGSLVHDALYQLMRLRKISLKYKEIADVKLKETCIEDGMWKIRAGWVFFGVDKFGKGSTLPKNAKPTIFAPKE